MNKSIVLLLIFILAVATFADVKKKRFDMGGASNTPSPTVEVAPAGDNTAAAKPVAAKPADVAVAKKRTSFYSIIAQEQKILREKLTAVISAMNWLTSAMCRSLSFTSPMYLHISFVSWRYPLTVEASMTAAFSL